MLGGVCVYSDPFQLKSRESWRFNSHRVCVGDQVSHGKVSGLVGFRGIGCAFELVRYGNGGIRDPRTLSIVTVPTMLPNTAWPNTTDDANKKMTIVVASTTQRVVISPLDSASGSDDSGSFPRVVPGCMRWIASARLSLKYLCSVVRTVRKPVNDFRW